MLTALPRASTINLAIIPKDMSFEKFGQTCITNVTASLQLEVKFQILLGGRCINVWTLSLRFGAAFPGVTHKVELIVIPAMCDLAGSNQIFELDCPLPLYPIW